MRHLRHLAVPSLLLLLPPGLAGQGGVEISVFPRAGLAAPDEYFYEFFQNFAGDGPMEWTTGSLGRAFIAGVGAELSFGEGGLRVRGEVLRTFSGWMFSVHSIERPRVLFEPPQINSTWLSVPTSITATSLQLILPTRLEVLGLSPYFMLGGGGKYFEFGEPTFPNTVGAVIPTGGFSWGLDLGGGLTVPVFRGVRLDVQVRDAITRYWDKTSHDLLYTSALLWPVW
ncbi:MAG: hypothetical protein RQ751_04275 [Longimicrobiales bacterium]|nr:hypothetical protein [Longimicrobiales bacterium]